MSENKELPPIGATQDHYRMLPIITPQPPTWEVVAHRGDQAVVYTPPHHKDGQDEVYLMDAPCFEPRADTIAALQQRPLSEYSDPVNHPSHYQLFPGQEAIDVIQAALTPEEFAGYLKGNALKYRLRAGEKGDTQQDIDKSNWYRRRLLESGSDKA